MKLFDRNDWRVYQGGRQPQGHVFEGVWPLLAVLAVVAAALATIAGPDETDVTYIAGVTFLVCVVGLLAAAVADYRQAVRSGADADAAGSLEEHGEGM